MYKILLGILQSPVSLLSHEIRRVLYTQSTCKSGARPSRVLSDRHAGDRAPDREGASEAARPEAGGNGRSSEAQTGTSGCELVSLERGDGDGRAPPTLCKWRSTATAG